MLAEEGTLTVLQKYSFFFLHFPFSHYHYTDFYAALTGGSIRLWGCNSVEHPTATSPTHIRYRCGEGFFS